ncbi:MAG: hypothetical protein ABRQ38_09345 [Candidatus Eremiobacterota bacterium]
MLDHLLLHSVSITGMLNNVLHMAPREASWIIFLSGLLVGIVKINELYES